MHVPAAPAASYTYSVNFAATMLSRVFTKLCLPVRASPIFPLNVSNLLRPHGTVLVFDTI